MHFYFNYVHFKLFTIQQYIKLKAKTYSSFNSSLEPKKGNQIISNDVAKLKQESPLRGVKSCQECQTLH